MLGAAIGAARVIRAGVPKWIWWLLLAAIVYRIGIEWHAAKVDALRAEIRAEVLLEVQAGEDKKLTGMTGAKDQNQRTETTTNTKIGVSHEKAVADLSARAERLRQRPKARGANNAAAAGLPGTVGASGQSEATATELLDDRLAGVSWDDLVYWSERSARAEAQVNALLDHDAAEKAAFDIWEKAATAAAEAK